MPRRLYLVRHGESTWNLARRSQGQTPHPSLTPTGVEQARRAAELLADDLAGWAGQTRIVTSDLARARQTAAVLADGLGVAPVVDERLREQSLGRLEGVGYEEAWAATADLDWSDPDVAVGGGESFAEVATRMGEVLSDQPAGVANVLVSHGDAIRAGLAELRGVTHLGPEGAGWVEVASGAVARVDDGLTWPGR